MILRALVFLVVLLYADAGLPACPCSGGTPTPPAGATAAGFTTLAFETDFTMPMPTGWLGGCATPGNGQPVSPAFNDDGGPHFWWMNIWWSATYQNCNTVQVQDPTFGGLVLDMPWVVDTNGAGSGTVLQSASWDYNASTPKGQAHSFPNNMYIELTFRISPVGPAHWGGLFTWTTDGICCTAGIELDTVELDTGAANGSDSAIHNWAVGNMTDYIWYPLPATVDTTQYHTFATRSTSDGTNLSGCGYIDNVFQNCIPIPGGLTPTEAIQRQFLILQNACDNWNYNGTCNGNDGSTQHMYVKSVRVWSCASWATTQCNGPVLSSAP